MLIQDLNFIEPVEQTNEIQGGKSSKAESRKRGARANAYAVGDKVYTKASTKRLKASPKLKTASILKKKPLSNGASNLKEIRDLHLDICDIDGLFLSFAL